MSGLSHTPGKRAGSKIPRGFESPLLRQNPNKPAPFGAFCFCSHQCAHQFAEWLKPPVFDRFLALTHCVDQGKLPFFPDEPDFQNGPRWSLLGASLSSRAQGGKARGR